MERMGKWLLMCWDICVDSFTNCHSALVDSGFSSKGLQATGMSWKAIDDTGKVWSVIASYQRYWNLLESDS